MNNLHDPSDVVKPSIAGLGSLLKDDGMLAMIREIRDIVVTMQIDRFVANHFQIEHPASAYVPGIPTPPLDLRISGTSANLQNGSYLLIHRVGPTEKFYGTKRARTDGVMMESNETDRRYPDEMHSEVWFGQHLCCIRMRNGNQCRYLCFVQYYERSNECMLPVDEIDRELGCLRLSSRRTPGKEGLRASGTE